MPDQFALIPPWVNGRPANGVPLSDRGLAYGDGVFETIRVTRQGPVLFSQHMQRLQTGLQRLGIPHDWATLEQEILRYPVWQQPGVVKLIVTRGQGGRGYSGANVEGPTRVFSCHPVPVYPDVYPFQGISVFPCQTRLSTNPLLAGIKHLNRLEQVLARQEWHGDEHQEGLMLDQQQQVIEGVFSNVFLVRNGVLATPDLDHCGVEGVMRRWLLEQFDDAGLAVNVGQVTLQDIELADEWFFCNSVYGIWPVRQWQHKTWSVGSLTRQAQQWVKDRWHF